MPSSLWQSTIGKRGKRHDVDACLQVLVSMSKELPVVVKYQMGDIGHIRCDVSNSADGHEMHAQAQLRPGSMSSIAPSAVILILALHLRQPCAATTWRQRLRTMRRWRETMPELKGWQSMHTSSQLKPA